MTIAAFHNHPGTETGPIRLASGNPRLRVAIVDEELPYPPNSGKRIRSLNLTQRLAERHDVTYICHANADKQELELARAHFKKLEIETLVVDRPALPRSGLKFMMRLAGNVFSREPYSVASHRSVGLQEAVNYYARTHSVDLWQVEWTPYATALKGIPSRRTLVMAHNVESMIWRRYGENEKNPFKRWYIDQQHRKFRTFEKLVVMNAGLTVAVSNADKRAFEQEFSARRVAVVENGVDTQFFKPAAVSRNPRHLVFVGSLDWRPNIDAVNQLIEVIVPTILQSEPGITVSIVGRNPSDSLRQRLAGCAEVKLHSNVGDVRSYLRNAGLMVVPLRIGGGSRLKILEALACGCPVVSTAIGAEGLELDHEKHVVITDGIPAMANTIVKNIHNQEGLKKMAEAGRDRVLRLYDWDTLADRLEELWMSVAEGE